MDTLEVNQLVWGKTKGHPWWPAIITSIQESDYKVEFIGESTHDFLRSSSISPYAKTPENARKVKNKVRSKKRLNIAITFADKIHQGEIPLVSVKNINSDIEISVKEHKPKTEKKENSSNSRLKKLKVHFKKCLKILTFTETCENFADIESFLNLVSAAEGSDAGIVNNLSVQESISQLLVQFPNIPAKICKYILKLCVKNESKFGRLAGVAEDFQILFKSWENEKSLQKEMLGVKNVKLRKHICRKFAMKLQELGIGKREAQIKALNIEENIRQQYPEMQEDYIRKSKLTLKHIKENIGL